jgi:hypothetical protein
MNNMFELETAIAEWRKQLLAAGIQTPVPLEELESHLREEIAQQTKSGVQEPGAFNLAIRKIGQPSLLNREFGKTGGFRDILSRRRTLKITLSINGLLGAIWLIWLLNCFAIPRDIFNGRSLFALLIVGTRISNGESLLVFLIVCAALAGSVLLIFDSKRGRSIMRTSALLLLFYWLIEDCSFACAHGFSIRSCLAARGIYYMFMLASILILHLPARANLKTTVNL